MSRTVQDQFFRKTSFGSCVPEHAVDRAYVPGHRARRREHPAFTPGAAPVSQDFEDSPTHGNKSAAFRRFAIRNKNQTIFPVEILNPHLVEFALISHSGIAHEKGDAPK